jgi:hypothetical protein
VKKRVVVLKPKRKILRKYILAEIREFVFSSTTRGKTITTIVVGLFY